MDDIIEISIFNIGEVTNRIFMFANDYYYIEDNYFKVEDVKRMPNYIKQDWFVHNRKILTLPIINKHLHRLNDIDDELKQELTKIRRSLFIESVLK